MYNAAILNMPQSQSADYNSTVGNTGGLGQPGQYSAANNHMSGGHIPLLTSPVPNQSFMAAAAALQLNQPSPAYVAASQIPGMYIYPSNAYLQTPNLMLGTTHGMLQNTIDVNNAGGVGHVSGIHANQKMVNYDSSQFGSLPPNQPRKPKNSIMSKTNLYINGLNEYDTDETVRQLVEGIIEPKSCKAMMSHGKCRGSGFIDCASENDAETVIQMLRNKTMPDGSRLAVKFAYENEKDDLNVYVRNLPRNSSFTNTNLEDLFREFGQVVSVKLLQSDNQYTGTGFVRFSNSDEAQRAVETMNGRKQIIGEDEKPVICKLADKGGRRSTQTMGHNMDNGNHQHVIHNSGYPSHHDQNGGSMLTVISNNNSNETDNGSVNKQSPNYNSYGHPSYTVNNNNGTMASGAWLTQQIQANHQQHPQMTIANNHTHQHHPHHDHQQQMQLTAHDFQSLSLAAAAAAASAGPPQQQHAPQPQSQPGFHDDSHNIIAQHHLFAPPPPNHPAVGSTHPNQQAALVWPPNPAAIAAARMMAASLAAASGSQSAQNTNPSQQSQQVTSNPYHQALVSSQPTTLNNTQPHNQTHLLQWGAPVSTNGTHGGLFYTANDTYHQHVSHPHHPHVSHQHQPHLIYSIPTQPQIQQQQQPQYRAPRTNNTIRSPPSTSNTTSTNNNCSESTTNGLVNGTSNTTTNAVTATTTTNNSNTNVSVTSNSD